MRALWSSASGMAAQQLKLDTIANNLANVNTTGFKSSDVQFKDMLYAQMSQDPAMEKLNGRQTTPGLRLGHGVVAQGTKESFAQGSLQQTGQVLDMALEGEGFFVVQVPNGNGSEYALTRDGSFKVGITEDGDKFLATAQGFPVISSDMEPILLNDYDAESIEVDASGLITAKSLEGTREPIGNIAAKYLNFSSTYLMPAGENLYKLIDGFNVTDLGDTSQLPQERRPQFKQRFVEQSNVDMPKQMTEMIVAQRAYSMNVKALQTADQMMGLANNLRG